jgi:hypothetical protein
MNTPPPEFGYAFTPRSGPGLHAYTRLEIHLRGVPSYQHFDPEEVLLEEILPGVQGSPPQISSLRISHPWPRAEEHRAGCGPVIALDRLGKEVEAFIFGGTASITPGEDQTIVALTSTAPIFENTPINPVTELFIDEVEILLAMRRAANLEHPGRYELRLASVESLAVYHACLKGVQQRLHRLGALEAPLPCALQSQLSAEIQRLEQDHPMIKAAHSLEEIL